MTRLEQLVSVLRDGRVFIQTHNYPDPDAIASAYGLQKLLQHYDIPATICYEGVTERLSAVTMLQQFNIEIVQTCNISDMQPEDKIVVVDAQKYNSNVTDLIGDEVACIDHHPTITACTYRYKEIEQVGACASLIARHFFENAIPLDTDTASALVYGIKMDTADLSRGVKQLDVDMYAKLFPFADNDLLNRMKINTMEFADLKAYGSAINNISVFNNIGYAFIPFACPDALIAMISDFILALDIIEFSVVYAVRENGYKFSVRSELPELHAGKIIQYALAGKGSGGGHPSMAGGFAAASAFSDQASTRGHEIRMAFEKAVRQCREEQKA